jgi:McrBC 5-methylcytosine restriction system component
MPLPLITVFEDRQKKLPLTESQKNDILSFREIIGQNNVRLDYDGTLQIMHYVGFISKGKTRLQVLPKIYENEVIDDEKEQRESMRVLLNLLRTSEFNQPLQLPEQQSSSTNSDILEIFISLFADKVFNTYSRQMNREYIDVTENSKFIKGKIDFTNNVRINPIRKDQHVIKYQSFEHDNIINNIIKTVCMKLIYLTKDSENKQKLKRALIFLDDAKEISLSKDLIDSAKFNQLNMPFKPVYEMAKMFFYNNNPESYCGDNTVCSFLIPLNKLYEFYLYKVLDNMGEDFNAKFQEQAVFAVTEENKNPKYIRPDIIVYKQKDISLIVDAKYKNPNFKNGRYNDISQADIYQVFAYARAYGIKKVALIYPQFDKQKPPVEKLYLKDSDADITLILASIDIKNSDIKENASYLKSVLDL